MKLIIDNENENISRNTKRRINRRNKISDDMKILLNKIKSENKKENKIVDEIKELEILLVRIKYADKPDKIESGLRELNRTQFVNKNLHEIEREKIQDYTGTFEMVGNLKVGDQIRQTHSRFRIIDDFESYINSIDQNYDSDDSIFNGYIYNLDTPQFNKVNRSQYGNVCDFKHETIEYRGNF